MISQALSTLTLEAPRSEAGSCSETSARFVLKVEQKWRNIHQCDKRNGENGSDALVICHPRHLNPSTEIWWKNSPSLLWVGACFRKHWKRSSVGFYSRPVLSVCICRHPVTQTTRFYKTYGNSGAALVWNRWGTAEWQSDGNHSSGEQRDAQGATGTWSTTRCLPKAVKRRNS